MKIHMNRVRFACDSWLQCVNKVLTNCIQKKREDWCFPQNKGKDDRGEATGRADGCLRGVAPDHMDKPGFISLSWRWRCDRR